MIGNFFWPKTFEVGRKNTQNVILSKRKRKKHKNKWMNTNNIIQILPINYTFPTYFESLQLCPTTIYILYKIKLG